MSKKPSKSLTIHNSIAESLIFTNQAGGDGIEKSLEQEAFLGEDYLFDWIPA